MKDQGTSPLIIGAGTEEPASVRREKTPVQTPEPSSSEVSSSLNLSYETEQKSIQWELEIKQKLYELQLLKQKIYQQQIDIMKDHQEGRIFGNGTTPQT